MPHTLTHHSIGNVFKSHFHRFIGECLLISSLPGKVSRPLVDIAMLALVTHFFQVFIDSNAINLTPDSLTLHPIGNVFISH